MVPQLDEKYIMYFKLTQEIEGQHFGKPEYSPMVFQFERPTVNVCIRSQIEEGSERVIIETDFQRTAKKNIEDVFTRLRYGYYSNPDNTNHLIDELKERMQSNGITNYSLPHDIMPTYFLDYCDNVISDLLDFSSRTYKTVRWVDDIKGDNEPFVNTKLLWSFDNLEWYEFVGKYSATFSINCGLYSSNKVIGTITDIVQSGSSEPLGHELLREAYSLCSSFPRSALLIAVSAAETGIKQCITSLQPETKWLVENSASPNILKLFREYVPTLRLEVDSDFRLAMPTTTILKPLEKIIQMRNIVSHGGQCKISCEKLEIAFDAIKNFLWVIDFIMGNKWAIRHLDERVRIEMDISIKGSE